MSPFIRSTLPFAFLATISPGAYPQEQPRPDTSAVRSIEEEILAQPDPDVVRLGKARSALMNAVQAGDTSMARRMLRYLEERFDTAYVAPLYPGERLLMSYIVQEYPVIYRMTSTEEDRMTPDYSKLMPITDHLFTRLRNYANADRRRLMESIRTSGEGREEQAFLQLLLRDILAPRDGDKELNQAAQDSINTQADEFIGDFPASRFLPFVRRQIRFVLRPSPWGLGYNFALGYFGVPPRMRAFGDFVDIGLGLEASYLGWYGEFRIDIGAAHRLSAPFEHNGTWPKDMMVMPVCGVLSLGRRFTLTDLLRVTPFLSVGGMTFSSTQAEKDLSRDFSLDLGTWGVGGHLDLIMGEELYLRVTAMSRFNAVHTDIAGSQYFFMTVGIGFFSRAAVRDE